MKTLAIIPARMGSKRIPDKNLKPLNGTPLIDYTLACASKCTEIDKIIVSSDSHAILERASLFGVDSLELRPASLAQDETSTLEVIRYEVGRESSAGRHFERILLLQPTSPFRKIEHVREAFRIFDHQNADTVVSVTSSPIHPFHTWLKVGDKTFPLKDMRSLMMGKSELPASYQENGAIFLFRTHLLARETFYGDQIGLLEMDKTSSLDIDTPLDWELAEHMIQGMKDNLGAHSILEDR